MSQTQVLVVDDERFFREAIAEVLAREGLAFALASHGEEALARAEDPAFGVVILDLNLPDLHGLEVLGRLRERRPELRVVILSASTEQADVLEALRRGAFDYLAKPLHEEELALAVRRALEAFDVAAGRARLRARLARLEAGLESLAGYAESGEVEALRRAAVDAAAEVLDAEKTSLVWLDPQAGEGRVVACHGRKQQPAELDPVRPGQGLAGQVLARGEPLLVRDVHEDPRFGSRIEADRYASASCVLAPVGAGGRTLGVLCAADRREGEAFEDEDLTLLRILARQLADLERGREAPEPAPPPPAADEARAEPEQGYAELVREICDAVTAEVEPLRVLTAALRPVARVLEAAPVSVFLLDPERDELVREAECDGGRRSDRPLLPIGRGLTGLVLESGQLVATPDPAGDPRFDAAVDTPADGAAGPLLCGPLRFRGKVLGIFRAFAAGSPDPRLGELLASSLSAALRNVLLYRSLVQSIEEVAAARRAAGRRGPGPEGAA